MRERGIIVEDTRPQTVEAIRRHQENAPWEYREESIFWNAVAADMDKRFFNGFIYPDGRKVPPPVIAFADLRNKNTIAAFDLYPDEYGIMGKISFNTHFYVDWVGDDNKTLTKRYVRGRYAQGETLLHEYIHVWQEIGRGKEPVTGKHVYHNAEWHEKARSLGLNPEGPQGVHTRPATPGSPIDIFLREHGILPPEGAYDIKPDGKTNWAVLVLTPDKKERKGRSTLTKYTCPHCGLNVRIGIKDDPMLVHDSCSQVFGEKVFLVKADGKEHNIYKAGK